MDGRVAIEGGRCSGCGRRRRGEAGCGCCCGSASRCRCSSYAHALPADRSVDPVPCSGVHADFAEVEEVEAAVLVGRPGARQRRKLRLGDQRHLGSASRQRQRRRELHGVGVGHEVL